jgi:hypothetical protein
LVESALACKCGASAESHAENFTNSSAIYGIGELANVDFA